MIKLINSNHVPFASQCCFFTLDRLISLAFSFNLLLKPRQNTHILDTLGLFALIPDMKVSAPPPLSWAWLTWATGRRHEKHNNTSFSLSRRSWRYFIAIKKRCHFSNLFLTHPLHFNFFCFGYILRTVPHSP